MRTRWSRLGLLALLAVTLVLGPVPAANSQPTPPPATSRAAKLLDVKLEPGCVTNGPAQVRAYPDLWRFDGERFDWILQGPAGTSSGQLRWWEEDDMYEPLDFTLATGHYRLTIIRVARKQIVADHQFDVMRCVEVSSSCHAVTFTNPAGNPAARVVFGGGEYLDEHEEETDKGGTLTVRPGRSVRVETFHEEIWWKAYGPGVGRSRLPNAGSHYSEVIEQHCGPTRTRGVISCATARRGVLRAWFHPPDNKRLSYRLDKWNTPIRKGRPGADRYVKLRLRVESDYTFRSYTAAAALPYDRAENLPVVRCVTAKRRGPGVTFRNRGESRVRVAYRVGGGEKVVLRLKRGASAKVRVGSTTVRWHTNALRPTSRWRIDRGRGVLS